MSSANNNKQNDNDTPPAAASAASGNNDATLAQAIYAVESLVELYGFSPDAANEAVNVVGVDLTECCNYILEKGLGADQGGAVHPVDPCSHVVVADSEVLQVLKDNDNDSSLLKQLLVPNDSGKSLFETPCMYHTSSSQSSPFQEKQPPKVAGHKSEHGESSSSSSSCSHSGENWLCLTCGHLYCGRYVNGHGVRHWEEHPSHRVAVSLTDLSVWCHECQSYLKTHVEPLQPVVRRLEELKFPSPETTKDGKWQNN
jgi:uncharacterized UBP type Zn finger protein